MKSLGRIKDDIYFQFWHQLCDVADRIDLQSEIEAKTGKKFEVYFQDRQAAYELYQAIVDWVAENHHLYCDFHKLAQLKSEDTLSKIIKNISGPVFRHILDNQFGRKKMISIGNRILANAELRDEFYAEGDKISERDFSFLLNDN